LRAAGEVAGQQPEADSDLVGVQAIADEVVEVVSVVQHLDRLLGTSAAPEGGGRALRAGRVPAGGMDPGAAMAGRGARAEGEEAQSLAQRAGSQADRPAVTGPAALLPARGGQLRRTGAERATPRMKGIRPRMLRAGVLLLYVRERRALTGFRCRA
jgi:hypothetical protein